MQLLKWVRQRDGTLQIETHDRPKKNTPLCEFVTRVQTNLISSKPFFDSLTQNKNIGIRCASMPMSTSTESSCKTPNIEIQSKSNIISLWQFIFDQNFNHQQTKRDTENKKIAKIQRISRPLKVPVLCICCVAECFDIKQSNKGNTISKGNTCVKLPSLCLIYYLVCLQE